MAKLILLITLLSIQMFDIANAVGNAVVPTLTCNPDGLELTFPKAALTTRANSRDIGIKFEGQSSSQCAMDNSGVTGSSDPVTFLVPYEQCGINIHIDGSNNIVYNQTVIVTYGVNPSNTLVFRSNYDEYNVQCKKPQAVKVTTADGLTVTADLPTQVDKDGTTNFVIALKRYDNKYGTEATTTEVSLGAVLYYQLELTTTRTDIFMYPQECFAVATVDSNGGSDKFKLFDGRCTEDTAFTSGAQTEKSYRYAVEAFKYFTSNVVYFTCNVKVCQTSSDGNGECIKVDDAANSCKRKRREVTDLSGLIGEDQPVELKANSPIIVIVDPKDVAKPASAVKSSSVFEGTKGTVIIVLLVVIVVIAAIALIKKILLPTIGQSAPAVSMKGVAGYDNNGMA